MHNLSDRLVIVGTSHIARQSVKEIKVAFDKFSPDAVAIELDQQRLAALIRPGQHKSPSFFMLVRQVGLIGTIFVLIGKYVQQKFGNIVNMEPGADMKAAFEMAKKSKKPVLLVDQPLTITLRNMKRWPLRERFRILWDVIISPFQKEKMTIDLRKVPPKELIEKLLGHMKGRYPGLHRILVADRDKYIAKAVKQYHLHYPDNKVLLVVGAGHVEGIKSKF